jgi:hypothetical protein
MGFNPFGGKEVTLSSEADSRGCIHRGAEGDALILSVFRKKHT